ncbi:hypothetical protein ONJ17_25665, partial [Salmonella enterica subsp. enterica serovar Agona]|nr:hypothetical protein [Salmonella enterica subsp. enterica serovar Agona]
RITELTEQKPEVTFPQAETPAPEKVTLTLRDVSFRYPDQPINEIGEARPSWQIWKELGEQLGLGQYYPWQDMQTRQLYQLNGDHA